MLFSSMKDLTPAQRKVSNRVTGACAGLLGAVALATGIPAKAQGPTTNSVSDHYILVQALERVGITVVLNSPYYCDKQTAGAYHSSAKTLVVCQENATRPYDDQGWTAYDLDTLRHEGHHVVQDCLAGAVGDSDFDVLFTAEQEFEEFVRGALTDNEIDWIIMTYADGGEEVIMHELEAFASAKAVTPQTIAEAISNTCKFVF
jgi:hypothetical protein